MKLRREFKEGYLEVGGGKVGLDYRVVNKTVCPLTSAQSEGRLRGQSGAGTRSQRRGEKRKDASGETGQES